MCVTSMISCCDRADFDGFLTGRDMFSSFMNGFVL